MLGMYTHAPDLTEIGGLYDCTPGVLRATEAAIKTPWAIATSVPGQEKAEKVLRTHGWMDLGHKYNQYHGPNFITLWAKEFEHPPLAEKTDGDTGRRCGWTGYNPPNGAYSCGLWVGAHPFDRAKTLAATKWLAVWSIPKLTVEQRKELAKTEFKLLGDTKAGSIWHTAQPHSDKNKFGAKDGY